MKTAVLVNGICRHTSVASLSWDIFPFEADWFLSTWNYTQETYFPEILPSKKEIDNIKHLFKHIEISDYEEYFTTVIVNGRVNPMFRSFKLLDSIRDVILSQGYERVIVFRPDLYLKKLETLDDNDFNVSNNTVKILGLHAPEDYYSIRKQKSDDLFFAMPIHIFEKYADLNFVKDLDRKFKYSGDIHKFTYHFFTSLATKVEPITKMKSTLVRREAENYYIQHNNIDFDKIADIFIEVYINKDLKGVGKFWNQFNKIVIQVPDMDKIRISQETGGILKLRKQ
jgi:hypothetical protein